MAIRLRFSVQGQGVTDRIENGDKIETIKISDG